MNDPYIIRGILFGLVLVLIYLIIKTDKANIVDAISVVTSSIGLFNGLKLCDYAYLYRNLYPVKDISLQAFLGGLALIWITSEIIIKKVKN